MGGRVGAWPLGCFGVCWRGGGCIETMSEYIATHSISRSVALAFPALSASSWWVNPLSWAAFPNTIAEAS